ncbi:MAG TPA: tetratricopeptide repeat protein [Fimbriimonadaceae bacterium]|mgnify:FL=1|nr:tetratricopeptide repeat protein [Fimbriimonadaceae bacterium]HRJ95506.1 tetratricopeptide repeat protein [Fimbriimonadaceae bacterium]
MPDTRLLDYEILDLLTSLAEKSLVIYENVGERVRFRLLETVREYGRDRLLEAGEMNAARVRHRSYYARLAEEIEPGLSGPDQIEALNTLELEHDNLRSALNWSLNDDEGVADGLRLAGVLGWFWKVRGFLREGLQRCRELLEAPGAREPNEARAKVLNAGGSLAETLGELDEAREMLTEALSIRRSLGDTAGIAGTLNNLGVIAARQANYEAAVAIHNESLDLYRSMNDRRGVANALTNMANVLTDQGDYARAKETYEESLTLKRKLGDKRGIANTLSNLATLAHEQNDHETARELQEEAYEIRREIGDRFGIAISLHNLGTIARAQGRLDDARALLEESLALRRELGGKQAIALAVGNLSKVARLQGDLLSALTLQQEGLETKFHLVDRRNTAAALEEIAKICALWGRNDEAVVLLAAAQALRKAIGAPIPPNEQSEFDTFRSLLEESLGGRFAELWESGDQMPWEEAVHLALALGA